jgi:flagellar biosynthesis protein FliQ
MTSNRLLIASLIVGGGILVQPATAYIDPGTGSYVLQIAIAFLVGLAFSVKLFWRKIIAFLRDIFSGKKEGGTDAS